MDQLDIPVGANAWAVPVVPHKQAATITKMGPFRRDTAGSLAS